MRWRRRILTNQRTTRVIWTGLLLLRPSVRGLGLKEVARTGVVDEFGRGRSRVHMLDLFRDDLKLITG